MSTNPTLQCPSGSSDTGAYRLSWEGPEGATFRLVAGSENLYQGTHDATTVTGQPEGSYTYRLGVVEAGQVSSWSEPCSVSVAPPSLGLALGLFSFGLLICLATVMLIIRGHKAFRRGEIG